MGREDRITDETVGATAKLLPEAILNALKKQLSDLNEEKQQLNKKIGELEKALKNAKDLIEVDKLAMKTRQEVLEKRRRRVVAETVRSPPRPQRSPKKFTPNTILPNSAGKSGS